MKRNARLNRDSAAAPNLADIARKASVSLPTASLALNNHPRVAARTKLRVMEAASKLGYVPNQAARRLVRSRLSKHNNAFDHVGFVFFDLSAPELDGPYLSTMRGVESELAAHGVAMVFIRAGNDTGNLRVTQLQRAGWVDGWLLISAVNDDSVRLVKSPHSPCVVLGGHRCKEPVHSVDVNFNAVGKLAAQHLASMGHQRIGFLGGSMIYPYQHDVLNGFRSAVRELGLDTNEQLIVTLEGRQPIPIRDRLQQLLAVRPAPTAIFAAELRYASAVIDALRQMEIQIPGEISVMGCELEGRQDSLPSITRIALPFVEVGRAGAALLREIAGKGRIAPRQMLIAPSVVEGWSCMSLNSQSKQESPSQEIKKAETPA